MSRSPDLTHTHTHRRTHTHTYTQTRTHAYTRTHTRIHTYARTHLYIYMHIHTHMHTHKYANNPQSNIYVGSSLFSWGGYSQVGSLYRNVGGTKWPLAEVKEVSESNRRVILVIDEAPEKKQERACFTLASGLEAGEDDLVGK